MNRILLCIMTIRTQNMPHRSLDPMRPTTEWFLGLQVLPVDDHGWKKYRGSQSTCRVNNKEFVQTLPNLERKYKMPLDFGRKAWKEGNRNSVMFGPRISWYGDLHQQGVFTSVKHSTEHSNISVLSKLKHLFYRVVMSREFI